MRDWVEKKGYATKLLADELDMDSKGLQIQKVRFTSGKYEHYHKDKTEFFYFLKDGGSLTMGGKEHMIKKGDVFIIKPKVVHAFDTKGVDSIECLNIKTNHKESDTYPD